MIQDTSTMLLSDYVANVYATGRELKQSSLTSYQCAAAHFSKSLGHPATIADIVSADAEKTIKRIKTGKYREYVRTLARSLGVMPKRTPHAKRTGDPTEWHVCPAGTIGQCPLCGCPALSAGEHRQTVADDGMIAPWVSRKKTRTGYHYYNIFEPVVYESGVVRVAREKPLPALVDIQPSAQAKQAGHVGLADYYRDVFEPIKLRSKAMRTKALYRGTLRSFARFLERGPVLGDLNNDTVSRFLAWFRAQGRAAPSTEKERCNLLAIWRFACRRGELQIWPEIEPEPCPQRVPQAWMLHQLRKILAECGKQESYVAGIPADKWWSALILVLYDTGERIRAVLNVQWEDVDLKQAWIVCKAETRKGGRADRGYKLGPDTVAALTAVRQAANSLTVDHNVVFPWTHSKEYLWPLYGKILRKAGLPDDSKSKFHRVRKTAASYYEAAGQNATEWLGHSSRKITRAYLDPRIVKTTHAADVLERLTDKP